jgi:hypothetical protein
VVARRETLCRTLHHSFEHLHGFRNRTARENDDELLSAVATRDVGRSERIPQYVRKRAQSPVAGVMTEDVVELLEVIEVAVGNGVGQPGFFEVANPAFKTATGEQTRQGVTIGLGLGELEGSQHRQAFGCSAGYHFDIASNVMRGS